MRIQDMYTFDIRNIAYTFDIMHVHTVSICRMIIQNFGQKIAAPIPPSLWLQFPRRIDEHSA